MKRREYNRYEKGRCFVCFDKGDFDNICWPCMNRWHPSNRMRDYKEKWPNKPIEDIAKYLGSGKEGGYPKVDRALNILEYGPMQERTDDEGRRR